MIPTRSAVSRDRALRLPSNSSIYRSKCFSLKWWWTPCPHHNALFSRVNGGMAHSLAESAGGPACAAHATHPPSPQPGRRRRSPRRGYSESPCSQKRMEGGAGGIAAQAKPIPTAEGGRTPRQDHPPPSPPHRRRASPPPSTATPPIAKYEQLCYSTPMKSADSPLLFLGACRIHEHCAKHRASPAAGALREQPKGQDPPRKPGTGACAVIRRRRFGAIPLHDGSVTVRYGTMTVPLQFHDGFFTVCYAL